MGDVEFHYHHAPGHTGDSMIIECGDYIFTGDFLFTGDGGVGRDDLPREESTCTGKLWMY